MSDETAPIESARDMERISALSRYKDRFVPTYLVDGFSGIASVHGIERITFFETVFNSEAEATDPRLQPVVTLAIPQTALLDFARIILAREEVGTNDAE